MFEIVKQQSWKETNLPTIVKAGLSGEDHHSYPAGITECIEPTGETTATGQQSGFGGGPLYTTYKRWASETIAGTEGKSWFWVEAGDSDWNEIAHLSPDIPGAKWLDESPGVPVGMRPLPKDFVTKLGDRINRPEFSEVIDALRETSVMRSFTALQESIAGNGSSFFSGLPFLIEPDETNFRNTISEWFLDLPDGLRALQTGIDRVNRRYGNIQAELFHDRSGWFWVESPLSKRIPLIWNGENKFSIEELAFDLKGLSDFAKNGNGIFLPGALWRTVVQQALLSPQAVVVGPAEASYWGEVPELFSWTGLPFPRLVQRPSLTILRKKFEDFSLEDIFKEDEPYVDSNDNWERFAKLRDQIADLQFQLGEDLPAHLQDALDKGFEKIHYQMNRQLEIGKRFYDEKSGNRKKRWHHARMELGIGGEPQERRKTLLEAVMEWGHEGIAEMHTLFSENRAKGVMIVREQTNG